MEIRPPERKVFDIKHPGVERIEAGVIREAPLRYRDAELYLWEAWEYEHVPKTRGWFIAGGVLALGLLAFALATGSLLFGIFVILASFVVSLYALRPPRMVRAKITEDGVQIGRRIFDFDDLKSFWIFYNVSGIKELSLESKKSLMPHIKMPLGGADPVKVRQALLPYIPEVRQEESFADILARILGF